MTSIQKMNNEILNLLKKHGIEITIKELDNMCIGDVENLMRKHGIELKPSTSHSQLKFLSKKDYEKRRKENMERLKSF